MAGKTLNAGMFVGICLTVIFSLMTMVRAGDTKMVERNTTAIEQNAQTIESVRVSVTENCKKVSSLEKSNEYLKESIDEIKKRLDSQNALLIQIARDVKK